MIRLLILLLWLPVGAMAQPYPAPVSDTVSDYANLLPPATQARISANLQAARNETGVHIALVTIARMADYGGAGPNATRRFADFATGWFNAWGIGDAARHDGILILVSQGDREMRIVLGDAYDVIWDGRAQRVIDTAMLPAFSAGDYPRGLEAGAQSAIDRLARPFATGAAVTADSGFAQDSVWAGITGILIIVAAAFAMIWMIFKSKLRDLLVRLRACPNCGARKLRVQRGVTVPPSEDIGGTGQRTQHCGACGDTRVEAYNIPSRSVARAAKSSSRRGFGGGRSGGGGASGKW
jgi:uncharacterized protein